MNDRELLEKAARAAGIKLIHSDGKPHVAHHDFTSTPCEEWNPLIDDGDAFRLLLAIKADVYHGENEYGEPIITIQPLCLSLSESPSVLAESSNDTRRAIVRAAAAMAGDV